MRRSTNNYARCRTSGELVFFNDWDMPTFADVSAWAFYRRPRGTDALTWRGQIIGTNPVEVEAVNTSEVGEA